MDRTPKVAFLKVLGHRIIRGRVLQLMAERSAEEGEPSDCRCADGEANRFEELLILKSTSHFHYIHGGGSNGVLGPVMLN